MQASITLPVTASTIFESEVEESRRGNAPAEAGESDVDRVAAIVIRSVVRNCN